MFVLVVGGARSATTSPRTERIRPRVVLMEKDRGRADQIADEIARSWCQGRLRGERPRRSRGEPCRRGRGGHRRRRGQLVICQMAKHHFAVPRRSPGQQPQERPLFKHLGVDELISPTRMILGSIEQDIRPRAAPPAPCRAISSSSRPSSTRARRRSAAIRGTSTSRTAARSWRSSGPTWPRRSAPTRSCGPATGSSPPAARNASRPSTSRSSGPPRRAEPRPRRLSACSVSLQLSACMG